MKNSLKYLFITVMLSGIVSSLILIYIPAKACAEGKRDVTLRLTEWRQKGKDQYKDQNFRGAQKTFIKLVQHNSTAYADYLLLARSANRAEDYLVASVAYQIYFELAKRKTDRRAKDEQLEVKKHVLGGVDKRKRKAHKARLEEALRLIKREELFGDKGALLALFDIHREGIFDPLLGRAHRQFSKALLKNKDQRLKKALLGSADRKELEQYAKSISRWGKSSWGSSEIAQREILALNAFATLSTNPKQSLEQIATMVKERYPISLQLVRNAQFLALIRLNRYQEVYLMADGLIQSLEGKSYGSQQEYSTAKKLKMYRSIKGLYGRVIGKQDANQMLVKALMMPSEDMKAQFKLPQTQPLP